MARNTRLKGNRFRSMVADSNCLWEVKRSRGAGVFECEVVGEPWEHNGVTYPGEFAGRRDVFTRGHIEQALAAAELSEERMRKHEEFYTNLGLGQLVHYHSGGTSFIRCEVVVAGAPHELDHPCVKQGERALKIVAFVTFVGEWMNYDLKPGGYLAQRMGHLFKPNASSIYENPKAPCHKEHADPQHLEPIELPEVAA